MDSYNVPTLITHPVKQNTHISAICMRCLRSLEVAMCAMSYQLSGSRRVSGRGCGRGLNGRGCGAAALRYRHTETHIFPAANRAPRVSRDPQTSFSENVIEDRGVLFFHACVETLSNAPTLTVLNGTLDEWLVAHVFIIV